MAVSLQAFRPELVSIIQQNTLQRVFHDALFPRLLFRSEAVPEEWVANIGEVKIFTRTGLIPVTTTPLQPGSDPTPKTYATEQWRVQANQFGEAIDTHMPTSRAAIASTFLRDTHTLGLNAGETLNRLVRDKLYVAYLGGQTVAIVAAAAAATQVRVASLNGFTEQIVDGQITPVSPANPMNVSFTTVGEPNNTVIGAVPDVPSDPFGPGVLTLENGLTVGLALRDGVLSETRSRILRVGGGATVDALTGASILTVNNIIAAIELLRANKVPPHADGYYHVHLPPEGVSQLFQDNHWQRLHQSLPDSAAYKELMIGRTLRSNFYENTETPNPENSGTLVDTSGGLPGGLARVSGQIGGEVTNQTGVNIARTLITGGGSIYENYISESDYITEAGVTGKVGEFNVTNGGVEILTNRIRFTMRAPLDRLQQLVGQAWSFSGDWGVPSDRLTTGAARFKRAIIIEHAGLVA